MAGPIVGGPDPTGMGQARNVDGAAKRAADTAKGMAAGFSAWREERKIKKDEKDLSRKQEAQRRLDAKAEKAKKAEDAAAPQIDEKAIQGAHMTEFNRFFLDAVRRGQSRTIQATSADSIIREVICHDSFIRAIANVTVRTPLEQMDTEYQKEMGGRRQRLAQQLMKAKEQKEFMIGELTAHELDIIYATMLGTPEDDAIAKTPGAVEIWQNAPWPERLPKPPEAFFMFLESIAIRERPESKGAFIGNVLKKLSVARTFVDTGDTTLRTLVDGAFINDYLYRTSAYPIDTAVESFHSLTATLFATPTSQIEPALGMPGVDYEKGYAQALSEKHAWVEQARQVVAQNQVSLEQAVAAHGTAVAAVEAAQKEVNRYSDYKKRTDKGEKITLRADIILAKNDPRIATALTAARAFLEAKNTELEAATKWLGAAQAAKAKVDKELSRREAECAKYQAEANPQAFARELASHFKSLLEENRDSNVDFGLVADRIAPRLPNPVIDSLLARATELARERDEFAHVFVGSQMADAAAGEEGGKGKSTTDVAHSIIGYRLPQFESKLAEFERAIETAELPDTPEASSKEPLRGIVRGLKHFGVQSSFIDEQIGKVRNAHSQPLRRAVQISVKSLGERSYRNLAGITDQEKIAARMAYEARTGDLEGRPGRTEGKWARFWQNVKYHLFTTESWVSRDRQRPGKLVKLYRWSIASDIEGLHPGNWLTRKPGRRPDGTPYKNWTPRVLDSIWGLTWKGYIVGTLIGGAAITTQEFHWYNPLTWVGRPATVAAQWAFNGSRPIYLPESQDHWYFPWSFTMPKASERQMRRVIDDNYDIPGRLRGRGVEYYKHAYGVGTHRLATEQDDSGMGRRLEWLQRHQDVLTFFQERTTLNMEVQARVVGDRPENCFTTRAPNQPRETMVAPVAAPAGSQTAAPGAAPAAPATATAAPPPQANAPNSCKSVGVTTAELARDYRPVTDPNDGYQPGMKVCCTIQVTSRRVPDGLKLNTYMADAFVDLLMAVEAGGGTVNYPYLTNAGNRGRWAREWYLVTPSEAEIITRFRVNERDNVRFLLMQGAEASSLLLPRCSSEAESPEFLRDIRRNEFSVQWRTETAALMSAAQPAPVEGQPAPGPADPLTQDATREILEQAFNTVKGRHPDWFMDRTHAYERRQAAMQVQELAIQTDTALDVLVAQPDILELVRQFGSRSSYSINVGRSDEFIQVLDQHKRMGGSLDDYNPYSTVPNAGVRVQYAIQMGYIQNTETFAGAADSQARSPATAGPAAPGSAGARPAGPPPIVDLSQNGQRFYTNPANEPFTGFFEGVMRGAFTSRGNDGRVFQGVMASRFAGDQARMERAIKEDMFIFLQRTTQADILGRDGIDVTGTGAAMTATARDMAKARNSMLNHMRGFVSALGRQ